MQSNVRAPEFRACGSQPHDSCAQRTRHLQYVARHHTMLTLSIVAVETHATLCGFLLHSCFRSNQEWRVAVASCQQSALPFTGIHATITAVASTLDQPTIEHSYFRQIRQEPA
jgi:hypothetical protein